ncbi:hypothetical protein PIB30_069783 [Stylosanthes scabra]|uniref:NB-ARC domain-containing protein n=1 Tax=Stylosanthes scabra TaxID=79078 RepID=A0ABU6SNC7_9FABA|nr:hypothetical protein [Stylosanthes scabra]
MAGVLVGGAFLSGFINVVLDRLRSLTGNWLNGCRLLSENFDVVETTKNVLRESLEELVVSDFNALQIELKEKLSKQKFFIVLDDVWSDDDYCWSVFANNASFPQSNGSAALEGIGREIVNKCDGLPLAAETLGRLLPTKHHVKEWNKILMSDIWEFSATNSKIIPALL